MTSQVHPDRLPKPPRVPRRQLDVRFGPYGAMYIVGRDGRVVSSFPLDKPVITVGGDFSNDIRVVHESVALFHFKITYDVNTRTSYILPLCRVALPVDRVLVSPDNTTGLGYPLQHGSRILIGRREFYFMHGKEKTSPRPSAPLPKTRGGSVRTFRLSVIPARDLIPCDPSKEQQMTYPLLPEVAKSTVYVPTLQPEHLPRKPPSTLLAVVSNTLVRMLRRGNDDVEDLNESDLFFGMTQDNAEYVTLEEVEENIAAQARAKDVSPERDPLRHRLIRRILHHLQLPHLKQEILKQGFLLPQVPPRRLDSTVPTTNAASIASPPIPTPKRRHQLPAQTSSNGENTYRPLTPSLLNPHLSLPRVHQERKDSQLAVDNTPPRVTLQKAQIKQTLARLEAAYQAIRLAWQNDIPRIPTPIEADYIRIRMRQEQQGILSPMVLYREEDRRDNRAADRQGVPRNTPLGLGNPVMMEAGQHHGGITTAAPNGPNYAIGVPPGMEVYDGPASPRGYWPPTGAPMGPPYGSPLDYFGPPVGPAEGPDVHPSLYTPVDQNLAPNTYADVEADNACPPVDPNIDPNLVNYQDAVPSSPPVHPGSPMDEDSPGWSARQTQQVQSPTWNGLQSDPAYIDQNLVQGVPLGEFPAHRQHQEQQHQHQQLFSLIQPPQDPQVLVNKAFRQEWRAKRDQPCPQFHGQGESGRSYSQGGGLFDHHAQHLDPTRRLTAGDVDAQVLEGSPFVTAVHTQEPQTTAQPLFAFYRNLGASGRVRMPPDDGTRANRRNAIEAGTKRLGLNQQARLGKFHPYTRPAKPKVKRAKPARPRQANSSDATISADTLPAAVTPIPTTVSDIAPSISENPPPHEEALEVAVASPLIELKEKVAVLRRSSESRESIVAYNASSQEGSHQPASGEYGLEQFPSVLDQEMQVDVDAYLPNIPAEGSSSSDEFPPLAPAQTASNSIADINISFEAPVAAGSSDVLLNDQTNLVDQATETAYNQTPEVTANITGPSNTKVHGVQQFIAASAIQFDREMNVASAAKVIVSGENSREGVEWSVSQVPNADLAGEEDNCVPSDSAAVQVAPAEAVEQVDELSEVVQEEVQEKSPKKITGMTKGRSRENVPDAAAIHAEVGPPTIQEVEGVAEKEQIGEEMLVNAIEAKFTDAANEPEAMVEATSEDPAVENPARKRRGDTTKSASVAQTAASITRRGKRKVDDIAPESAEEELPPAKITRTLAGRQAKAASAEPKPSSLIGEGPSESSNTVVADAMDVQAARATKSVPRGRKTAVAKTAVSSGTQEAFLAAVEIPGTRMRTRSADTAPMIIALAVPEAEVEAVSRRRTRSAETAGKAPASKVSVPTRTRTQTTSSDVSLEAAAEELGAVPEPASAPRRSCRLAAKAEAVPSLPTKSSRKRARPVDEDEEEVSEERGVPIPMTRGSKAAAAVVERGDERPSPPKKSRTAEAPKAVKRVLPKRAAATAGRHTTPFVTAQPEPVIEETTDKENAITSAKTARTRAHRAAPTRATRSQARK